MVPSPSPKTLYNQRLRAGALKPDAAQVGVADALEDIYKNVIAAHKPAPKNFLSRLRRAKTVQEVQGLYIHGGTGRGKSMLMDLFFAALPDTIKKRRVHFHEFMIGVHDYLHTRRAADDFGEGIDSALPALALRLAEQAQVLCFDEFHVTDVADAMILGRLFTALFDRGVIVVATSNWLPDRLYEGGLQRDRFLPFIDLLKRRLKVLHLDSPTDYRTAFLTHDDLYMAPLGPQTAQRADELFFKLSGGRLAEVQQIEIKGRFIAVNGAGGVARVTFDQMCGQPLGAEDYITLARVYPTVFLENVPRLNPDRRNEAKRFMTLIDALYEARTRLIITADAPPEEIYTGTDHGFEFQRTVSRLQEMGAESYRPNEKGS